MIGSRSEVAMPVFPGAASLVTRTWNRQERPGAVRHACGASRRESDELHTGFGDSGRAVAYCRPVGMLQAQQRPDAGRCAKHDRADPRATP